MSTTSLQNVFRELFVAPLSAACKTEEDYRRIWADWLDQQKKLLSDSPDALPAEVASKLIDIAPVINLDGSIEVGITMRISSAKEFNAELGVGLSVGPIYASGGFGFVNRTAQESVFQASARYALSNFDRNLRKYLEDRSITVTNADELTKAIDMLRKK